MKKINKEPQEVKEITSTYFTIHDFEGKVEEVVEKLKSLDANYKESCKYQNRNPKNYYTYYIDVCDDYEGGYDIEIYGIRMETTEEAKVRAEREEKELKILKDREKNSKAALEKKEREDYERLKAKFEKNE